MTPNETNESAENDADGLKSEYAESLDEAINWIKEEWKSHEDAASGNWKNLITDASDYVRPPLTLRSPSWFVNHPREPMFIDADGELDYRRGFVHGFSECSEIVLSLYCKKGFVRIKEIYNIVTAWLYGPLMRWRRDAFRDVGRLKRARDGHPIFRHDSWPRIRKACLERDGNECVVCGSSESLEVDHIEEVQHGGLPTPDNLRTLCENCHDQKRYW